LKRRNPEVEAAQVETLIEEANLPRKVIASQLSTDEGTISKIFNGKFEAPPLFWFKLGRLASEHRAQSTSLQDKTQKGLI
jgi:hypothetical protein